jgi:hypothetical protein
MINLQFHKGSPCICSSVFCQEGFCLECDVYLNHPSCIEKFDRFHLNALRFRPNLQDRELVTSQIESD